MILAVEGLRGWYGRAQVLFDVAVAVAPGEAVALLGRNGAGKSSTFKAIAGLLDRRAQRLAFAGEEIARRPAHTIARAGLAYVPEDRRIFADLTVLENLEVGRQPARAGVPRWTPARLYDLFPPLHAARARRGGTLSGGEQQMLTIARALMGQPRLILLDEPCEGLAPKIVADMARAILALKQDGLAILMSEQNLAVAGTIADRAVILDRGRSVFAGPFVAVASDAALCAAYLAVG